MGNKMSFQCCVVKCPWLKGAKDADATTKGIAKSKICQKRKEGVLRAKMAT